ncbi:MAG TPA: GGDEF domain-containing protein [Candidatus Sulfotelmatobacter sp.]|nr:GGDEF domain-containing protein [Candidatus Sulfotelmatobacter sp.]
MSDYSTEVGDLLFSLQALLIREAEGAPESEAFLMDELDAEVWIDGPGDPGDVRIGLPSLAVEPAVTVEEAPAPAVATDMFGRPVEPEPDLWDPSTGAATLHALNREISLRGSRVSGALVTMEISPLPEIRTQYGDAAAEGVLKAIVEAIPFTMRAEDQVFRTGVDELTLYVPRSTLSDAAGMALRLQLAVKDVLVRRELPPIMLSVRPSERAAA